jgi:PAS domain S-box-containing protein
MASDSDETVGRVSSSAVGETPRQLATLYEMSKRAQAALLENEQQFQLIADALPVLVSFVDANEHYRFVNVGYETWFGRKRAEVVGKHLAEVLGTEAYVRVRPHIERVLDGETVTYEAEVPYEHGGNRFIEATYIPHRDDLGRVAGFAALVADISERKRRELAMAALHRENEVARVRAEELYRFAQAVVTAERKEQVFEAGLDALERILGTARLSILAFDGDGVMRFKAFRNLSAEYRAAVEGHSPWARDAVAPQPIWIADAANDPAMSPYYALFEREGIAALAFIPLVAAQRLHGKFMVYYDQPHAQTEQELALATTIANHLAAAIVRFDAVARLEETVRYHELFTGVLAHDLRNPLSAIVTATHVVLMHLEGQGDKALKPLNRILTSGERMARMIEQLLDFTRARLGGGFVLERSPANLARLCDTAIGELEVAHPGWRFERRASGNLDGAWDCDRLLQVISNLVANAGTHGNPGSTIVVGTEGTNPDAVVLTIHNEGSIPTGVLSGIFDPFSRARRKPGHPDGLGLGLYISKEIVEAHGGSITVESSEATGTTLRATLPRRRKR